MIYSTFRSIFNPEFYSEIFQVFKTYKRFPNQRIIVDLLSTINSGNKIYKFICDIINKEKLESNDIILYSYWFDKCAYAVAKTLENKKAYAGISRAHSYDIYLWRNQNNYLPLKNYLLKNISFIFFISEHGKNYFSNLLKIKNGYSQKLKLSKLGTYNNNELNPSATQIENFVVLSCSNIIKLKRINKIIEALALINDINIEWIHIGHGWQNEQYEKEIINMAETLLKNKTNIKYKFIGKLSYEKVLKYYKEHHVDIFINVSETEGLPVSIMEAMSYGIPVVATSVGGTPEIVNNSNGILLSANPSEEEIASAVFRMHSLSVQEISQCRNNAYKMWKDNYNAEQNYNKFVDEISKL
jgi:glycosyltransferase involved in cell wall biosynthesis